jgi:hypothetical protein
MTVTLPIVDEADVHWLPVGNTSVPRCMTCGGRVVNGRWRRANDANGVEIGILEVELHSLFVRLQDPIKISLPIIKMVQTSKA